MRIYFLFIFLILFQKTAHAHNQADTETDAYADTETDACGDDNAYAKAIEEFKAMSAYAKAMADFKANGDAKAMADFKAKTKAEAEAKAEAKAMAKAMADAEADVKAEANAKASPEIDISDLFIGDLIFFMDKRGHSDHVAIFSKIGTDGKPYITHSISNRNAGNRTRNAVMTTLLPPTSEANPKYTVFRNTHLSLAISAGRRIIQWTEYLIPYDEQAAEFITHVQDHKDFCNPELGTKALYEYTKEMSCPNFFRRIKYASRKNYPILPENETIKSSGRGFRCTEAAILAYQVEELADMVIDLSEMKSKGSEWFSDAKWVSDKYAAPDMLNLEIVSPKYLEYQKKLNLQNGEDIEYTVPNPTKMPTDPDHKTYPPSLITWDAKHFGPIDDFIKHFKTSLPLDSKIATADVLLYHVRRDEKNWFLVGNLSVEPYKHTDEQKLNHKTALDDQMDKADELNFKKMISIQEYKPNPTEGLKRSSSFSDKPSAKDQTQIRKKVADILESRKEKKVEFIATPLRPKKESQQPRTRRPPTELRLPFSSELNQRSTEPRIDSPSELEESTDDSMAKWMGAEGPTANE